MPGRNSGRRTAPGTAPGSAERICPACALPALPWLNSDRDSGGWRLLLCRHLAKRAVRTNDIEARPAAVRVLDEIHQVASARRERQRHRVIAARLQRRPEVVAVLEVERERRAGGKPGA